MTHYTYNDVLAMATPLPNKAYSRATVNLGEGDTCFDPGSTKYRYIGPGEIVFTIHPSGWNWEMDTTVSRRRTLEGTTVQTTQTTIDSAKALDILLDVIRKTANRVVSSVETIKDHPTFVTKSMIHAEHQRLQGALEAYSALAFHLGFDTGPASVCAYRDKADHAVAELKTLPTGRRAR